MTVSKQNVRNYRELSEWFHELSIKRSDATLTREEVEDFINECRFFNPEIPDFY